MEKIIIAVIIITALVVVAGILIYSNWKLRREHKHSELLTDQLITTLVSAIDAKDPYTQGHSIRVAMYSRELARRAGKPRDFQKSIYYLGMVHDVGKIGIPGNILRKTDKLTPEEYAKVREHPTLGGEILDGVTEIPRIRIGALYHHEHYDGGGYPFGMIGDSIPEEARIIAVADAYDEVQRDSVSQYVFGRFIVFLAQFHRYGRRGAHADTCPEGCPKVHKGKRNGQSGDGFRTYYLSDKHPVDDVIQRSGRHGYDGWQGILPKQLPHRLCTKLQCRFFVVHYHLFFQVQTYTKNLNYRAVR